MKERFLRFAVDNPWAAFVLAGFAAAGFFVLAFFVFIYQPDQQEQRAAVIASEEAKAQSDRALQASRDDNAALCDALRIVAYPPPNEIPQTEFGKRLVHGMQLAVQSPDCPQR